MFNDFKNLKFFLNKFTNLVLIITLTSPVTLALELPRAYLKTDAGIAKSDTLIIDGKYHKISNPLMNTFDISEFDYLKGKEVNAYQALYNHYRYGVVGTRGFIGGAVTAASAIIISKGKIHSAVPASLFLAGFIYGINCRHMARHYLHNAINTLNGITPNSKTTELEIQITPKIVSSESSVTAIPNLDITYFF